MAWSESDDRRQVGGSDLFMTESAFESGKNEEDCRRTARPWLAAISERERESAEVKIPTAGCTENKPQQEMTGDDNIADAKKGPCVRRETGRETLLQRGRGAKDFESQCKAGEGIDYKDSATPHSDIDRVEGSRIIRRASDRNNKRSFFFL